MVRSILAVLVASAGALATQPAEAQDVPIKLSENKPWRTTEEMLSLPPGAVARFGVVRVDPRVPLYSVAFSHDGKMIVTGGEEKRVEVWDVKSNKVVKTLAGNLRGVPSVAFSPDDRLIASAGHGGDISIWDVENAQRVVRMRGHTRCPFCFGIYAERQIGHFGRGEWLGVVP
jgi:WD40 repeat protein